jgi:hypothetical protein
MKKIYILITLLAFSPGLNAQNAWGPPFPLTDSLTDNVNATLSIVPGEMIQPDTLYMLWERNPDPSSTGIYARNLTTMAGAFMVAAQFGAHFRHPRVFARGTGDTLFYFSYETDMNGSWDLYFSAFLKNEVAIGPFPFIRSSQNERSLNFGSPQCFSWEKEGIVYVKGPLQDTALLWGEGSSNPVQSGELYVAFELPVANDLRAFYSKYNSANQLWDGPYPIDITGTNTHLTFGNDSYSQQMSSGIFWQHKDGPFWEVKGFDISDNQSISFNNFAGFNNISPSFCFINLITDHAVPAFMDYSTFASDVSGNMEIYVNNVWGDTVYSNISGYGGIDTHPQLFNNFHPYGLGFDNQLYDIWESYRGGHWQLWGTTMDILTGENILKADATTEIRVYPNPFADKTRIAFSLQEPGQVTVGIYDLSGRNIKTLGEIAGRAGNFHVKWDGTDASGHPVPAGIYVCAVRSGGTIIHGKIIRR